MGGCQFGHFATPARSVWRCIVRQEACRCTPVCRAVVTLAPNRAAKKAYNLAGRGSLPALPVFWIRIPGFCSAFWIRRPELPQGAAHLGAEGMRGVDPVAVDSRQVADELAGLRHRLERAVEAPHQHPASPQ